VVDDVAPEASSPSSIISNASSSSNLSTELPADPGKPTTVADSELGTVVRYVSDDKMQPSDDGKSGTETESVNTTGAKSSVMSTHLNVVENARVSTPMSSAVTTIDGTRLQPTRNIVVVKSTTTSASQEDDAKGSSLKQNVNSAREQIKEPRNGTLMPGSTSVQCFTPVHIVPALDDITCPSKSVADGNGKRRQRSVDADRQMPSKLSLRRMESSPCNLAAAVCPCSRDASPQLPGSNGRVKTVVPRAQPATMKPTITHPTPQQVVTSRANSGASTMGQISRLTLEPPQLNDRVLSTCISNKDVLAARQRHRSSPFEHSPVKNTCCHSLASCDTRKQAVRSRNNSYCDKDKDKSSKLEADLTEGDHVSSKTHCQTVPNATQRTSASTLSTDVFINVVNGRVKKISAREGYITPVANCCMGSEKASQKPTVSRRVPRADLYTGPVITDMFESLRRRQQEEAAAAAVLRHAKIPGAVARGSSKPRPRPCTRSARSKSGRSSVASIASRTKQPSSRQPSAGARKSKTSVTSAASSAVGISAKTPRGRRTRKDCASRGRRKRSKSSGRKVESEVEPEVVTGASDVTLIGGIGWQIAAKCEDVSNVQVAPECRYEPPKNDKTEGSNAPEHFRNTRRSQFMSYPTAKDVETSNILPQKELDRTGGKTDNTFGCVVGAVSAKTVAVIKHKRSTSSSDAQHHDSVLAQEVLKDQQENCKFSEPELTDTLPRQDGNGSNRLYSRRRSQSADPPTCISEDTGVNAEEIQLVAAAAADPPIFSPHDRPSVSESQIFSAKLNGNEEAELKATTYENMRSDTSSRRSSKRRSRPAYRVVDGGQENPEVVGGASPVPAHTGPEFIGQQAPPMPSSNVTNGGWTCADEERDVADRISPRFIRKHDSLVALIDSRRSSVEKAQGTGQGTLDGDATLSWHNSLFDNNLTASDMVHQQFN